MTPTISPKRPTGSTPRRSLTANENLTSKIQYLMLFRVIMITLLLGATLAFDVAGGTASLSDDRHLRLLWIIISAYGITIAYSLVLRYVTGWLRAFATLQQLLDIALAGLIVHYTGGTESLFLFMFSFAVLSGALLLYRRGALLLAGASTITLLIIFGGEAMGWSTRVGPLEGDELRTLLLSCTTNISAVFLVALLSGYLAEQLRDAGQRLQYASEDLEAVKALNAHILTSINSGLVSFTLDDRIIFFNPAAERITGLRSEEVLYRSVLSVFPSVRPHRSNSVVELDRWETQFKRPDGTNRALGMSMSPLLDTHKDQRGWILIFQDLSQVRQMQRRVKRSERFAALGKMAAGIAHEIRNPLASMSGSIQMLGRSDRFDPIERKLMNIVLREIDRLNELVGDFLQFARPAPPQLYPTDLSVTTREVVAMFAHRPEDETPIELSSEIADDLIIEADPDRLKQVLWNLLKNAVEASPGGRISVKAWRETPTSARIEIADDGVGMDEQTLAHIFDPFFTTKDKGSGLGLSLVLRIIEDHGGELTATSEVGHGSTLTVSLPLKIPLNPSAPVAPQRGER